MISVTSILTYAKSPSTGHASKAFPFKINEPPGLGGA
jgi:hypothetical protein